MNKLISGTRYIDVADINASKAILDEASHTVDACSVLTASTVGVVQALIGTNKATTDAIVSVYWRATGGAESTANLLAYQLIPAGKSVSLLSGNIGVAPGTIFSVWCDTAGVNFILSGYGT